MRCKRCGGEIIPCTTGRHCVRGYGYMHKTTMSHYCDAGELRVKGEEFAYESDLLVVVAATPPKKEREKFLADSKV